MNTLRILTRDGGTIEVKTPDPVDLYAMAKTAKLEGFLMLTNTTLFIPWENISMVLCGEPTPEVVVNRGSLN